MMHVLSVTFSSGFYLVLREASSQIPARVWEVSILLLDCPHLPTTSCHVVTLGPCDSVEIEVSSQDLRFINRRI